ncbi:iron ABC transporter permease [Terrihabitans rhizophilus]|uniref:Iron ABC transporter permease n=1 Tax=Terrihabitans rhizophilus TaxID=3092662 RepID=A0ABU4RMP8_9HYPH|nr:iron ABC transporter permease [Terrihabitans sp. PJ23]MDX6805871.1 iron ABC transporter permease [Terrihabitans sp. PJ23]
MTIALQDKVTRRRLLRGFAGDRAWLAGSVLVAALVCLPILSLVLIAAGGSQGLWGHVIANVLPSAARDTLILLAGVGVLVCTIGTGTAWLVTAYDFPGRRSLQWALLLPLSVPTYIIAYAYLDILHPVGIVQTTLRDLLGYASPRDFRLPDIRSMTGCILLLGLVLYPYVYLTTRAMFLTQAANLIEVSRTLGTRRGAVFRRVAVPLARPAIVVGMSLALMEALNDIGASEFLGVRTLTVSIYSTWVSRSDLPGAAQISLVMLLIIVGLLALERWARREQRFAATAQRPLPLQPVRLTGLQAAGALLFCATPVALGFAAPAAYLVHGAYARFSFAGISEAMIRQILNTVTVSAIATLFVLACGLAVAYSARLGTGRTGIAAARASTLGYAVPGTVLAIGLLAPVGLADVLIADTAEAVFGISTGLLLLGGGAALIMGYAARFMAISTGGIEAGFSRISPSLDHAARMLGHAPTAALRRVHLPLSRTAIAATGLLVFVDCMKELPATLLLRPLNFDTLATYLYGEAARGTYEEGSIAALLIVLIGIVPVVLLSRVGSTAIPRVPGRRSAEAPASGGLHDPVVPGLDALGSR